MLKLEKIENKGTKIKKKEKIIETLKNDERCYKPEGGGIFTSPDAYLVFIPSDRGVMINKFDLDTKDYGLTTRQKKNETIRDLVERVL